VIFVKVALQLFASLEELDALGEEAGEAVRLDVLLSDVCAHARSGVALEVAQFADARHPLTVLKLVFRVVQHNFGKLVLVCVALVHVPLPEGFAGESRFAKFARQLHDVGLISQQLPVNKN